MTMAPQKIEITLDGKKMLVEPGLSILEVAESQGIRIPTLCHDRRLEPYASCWVCLVKVERAKGFVPSCGTRVAPGTLQATSPRQSSSTHELFIMLPPCSRFEAGHFAALPRPWESDSEMRVSYRLRTKRKPRNQSLWPVG